MSKIRDSVPEHEIWRDVKFFGFIDVILKMVKKTPVNLLIRAFRVAYLIPHNL
jgi:hypothetical protein